MQERGRVRVMGTQVAEHPVKTDVPKRLEARDEKAEDQLETVYVGMLVAAAAALLALLFRRRMPL
jgi:hypothetical protein